MPSIIVRQVYRTDIVTLSIDCDSPSYIWTFVGQSAGITVVGPNNLDYLTIDIDVSIYESDTCDARLDVTCGACEYQVFSPIKLTLL